MHYNQDSSRDRASETFCAHTLVMLRPCQLLLHGQRLACRSVKLVPYLRVLILVCRYAPIFVFSKATY